MLNWPLRLLEFLQLRGVGRRLARIEFHLSHTGPGIRHFRQRRFFEVRRAGHGIDEVRDQIGAPLVDRLHVGPLLVHVLFQRDQPIVTATAQSKNEQQEGKDLSGNQDKFVHGRL